MVPVHIVKRRCPFEGVGCPDFYAGIRQILPKAPRCTERTEMVVEQINLYPSSALIFENLRQFKSRFVIPEYVELKADDFSGRRDCIEYC